MKALLRHHAPSGPALWLVAGRGVGFVATFAVPLVLVRLFDQATFGTYKQLFLIYGTLFGLAQLGVAESLYYFVPRRPEEAGRHAANAVAHAGGGGPRVRRGADARQRRRSAAGCGIRSSPPRCR